MSARHPNSLYAPAEHQPVAAPRSLAEIEARIDEIGAHGESPEANVQELLSLGEGILEHWLLARGEVPSLETKEDFRLLALHRQGAKGDPSFNACRETCRELAYHNNLIMLEPEHPDRKKRARLAAMLAKHLGSSLLGVGDVTGAA